MDARHQGGAVGGRGHERVGNGWLFLLGWGGGARRGRCLRSLLQGKQPGTQAPCKHHQLGEVFPVVRGG